MFQRDNRWAALQLEMLSRATIATIAPGRAYLSTRSQASHQLFVAYCTKTGTKSWGGAGNKANFTYLQQGNTRVKCIAEVTLHVQSCTEECSGGCKGLNNYTHTANFKGLEVHAVMSCS